MEINDRVNETVTLERFRLACVTTVSSKLIERFAMPAQIDISSMPSFGSDDVAVRVIQEVYGEKVGAKEVKYPADWWQAFKARWAPRWWLDRWPVKHTTVRMEAVAFYPKVSAPEHSHRVIIMKKVV